jgi:hypothetical protein
MPLHKLSAVICLISTGLLLKAQPVSSIMMFSSFFVLLIIGRILSGDKPATKTQPVISTALEFALAHTFKFSECCWHVYAQKNALDPA